MAADQSECAAEFSADTAVSLREPKEAIHEKHSGLAILAMMLSATVMVMAAQNSQTFYLATAARAGNVQLPHGICEVTWDTISGSRVRLTIRTEGDKTVNGSRTRGRKGEV